MKSFSAIRQSLPEQTETVSETVLGQDLPVVLVLRRSAFRIFPDGQRVATYRNDNYDLNIAIPYNPKTLGKARISTAVGEEVIDESIVVGHRVSYQKGKYEPVHVGHVVAVKDGKVHIMTKYGGGSGNSKIIKAPIEHVEKLSEEINEDELMALVESTDSIDESVADNLFGMYVKHLSMAHTHDQHFRPLKHIVGAVEKRYEEKAAEHFKKAGAHYHNGNEDLADHHFRKYKQETAVLGEEQINELSKKTLSSYLSKSHRQLHKSGYDMFGPSTNKGPKRLQGIERAKNALKEEAEPILEATMHSIHKIVRNKAPADITFKSGKKVNISHETASRIFNLHRKMNAKNKAKIELMINSGPEGVKKVDNFAIDHMK